MERKKYLRENKGCYHCRKTNVDQHRKDYPSKAIAKAISKAIAKAKEGTSDSNTIKNENIRVTQGAGSDIQSVYNYRIDQYVKLPS